MFFHSVKEKSFVYFYFIVGKLEVQVNEQKENLLISVSLKKYLDLVCKKVNSNVCILKLKKYVVTNLKHRWKNLKSYKGNAGNYY